MIKKIVRRQKEISIDGDTLEELMEKIQNLSIQFGKSATVDVDFNDFTICILYSSKETEAEYHDRTRSESLHEAMLLNERKAQYEKLKLEFDGL